MDLGNKELKLMENFWKNMVLVKYGMEIEDLRNILARGDHIDFRDVSLIAMFSFH